MLPEVRFREGRYGSPPQAGEQRSNVVKAGTALHPNWVLEQKKERERTLLTLHMHTRGVLEMFANINASC